MELPFANPGLLHSFDFVKKLTNRRYVCFRLIQLELCALFSKILFIPFCQADRFHRHRASFKKPIYKSLTPFRAARTSEFSLTFNGGWI